MKRFLMFVSLMCFASVASAAGADSLDPTFQFICAAKHKVAPLPNEGWLFLQKGSLTFGDAIHNATGLGEKTDGKFHFSDPQSNYLITVDADMFGKKLEGTLLIQSEVDQVFYDCMAVVGD